MGTAAVWCSPSVSNAWRPDGSPYKRLEDTTFTWPAIQNGTMALNHAQFEALFAGLDWRKVKALETRLSESTVKRTIIDFLREGILIETGRRQSCQSASDQSNGRGD
ncbi:IS66 family insertion sequence element accessory protein TnpB [Sedimentitalea sp. JM2-8]|uniref:IS66 family insertion sequence element accessory protein TnpB n=1 Tax=Sedimentitalea xiamensis TaxID=3050037 RepID=A0ABT7FE96_9RHOB|nr:IS66 family insertion sequence element accessory protein TnpB [Sedimentitalea xiamensis]MDK3073310.1 IS66 family insertion sequence element accessory protein TnpB [Sedimentitalea xiamensis]